ncbi:DUF5805 domain-containing protein [Salarchaeum sp. JOR-1]|uniref:DUF5805 domain-containing protein n=1 Tax=Salarchaeum sp. JOR-1 TaxID=2599399 RepID=UPI0011982CFE|nr:DUF5805 domain-containing protein [Salarchaeum sp. JOR-1]QDX41260.1 hypothetical protein FQU85_10260 [Salarchaeum sp. JOR-1]
MSEGAERTSVKTYVPRWQKEEWVSDAEELDMTQSEFVRAMVQAGRQNIQIGAGEGGSEDLDPGGDGVETGLKEDVRSCLESEGTLGWDELLAAVTDDVEDRVEEAIQSLEDEGAVRYRPREGGYTLVDE